MTNGWYMGRDILVSILTIVFNGENNIGRTIESILTQTYKNIEYIVIDGMSNDNTVEVAETYRQDFEYQGIAYKIISEPYRGMYDALNKGARLAKEELVV